MLFQEFWKVKSLLVEQPNGHSSECILTREFGKFLVTWVAIKWFSYESILTQEVEKYLVTWVTAKWFLIWVCSDMFIQTREFCKFVVTLAAAKRFFISSRNPRSGWRFKWKSVQHFKMFGYLKCISIQCLFTSVTRARQRNLPAKESGRVLCVQISGKTTFAEGVAL